jgi:hypothetical protein
MEDNGHNYLFVQAIDEQLDLLDKDKELSFEGKEKMREQLLDVQEDVMVLLYIN